MNKHQKCVYWRIYVNNNKIYRQSRNGDDGKIREFPEVECEGKNIGRKNETSDHEQALFEAYSMWLKKQDQNYSIFNIGDKPANAPAPNILPMLANKFTERQHYLAIPFTVSPKLDGVRVVARRNEENNILMTSRMGKEFIFMEKLRQHLEYVLDDNIILDGELYSHTIPFNAISGATRAKKTPSEYDDKIEMWIFDIADTEKSYKDRMDL